MEGQESYLLETEDVQEQIDQQRVLAAQLQEKLEQDELQLASKEQQNELLKSKLSLLKSRAKAKRSSGVSPRAKDVDGDLKPDNVGRKQTLNSTKKGKINILREQLEQNRLRFERHGIEMSEDAKSMEAMVEQLRHELEERDVTIHQLQVGHISSGSLAPDEITDSIDLGAQLQKKEDEVNNLMTQVSDLQNTILELQENLKEKDCVIEARTQAISLLSEDMSKKWRANVDMLEETRQQMQMMQENFIRIETGLNAEIGQLNEQLQNSAKKLLQAEQNAKVAESIKNDLAAQNAELVKEVNCFRENSRGGSELEVANSRINELTEALTEANRLTVKLKAEHKSKVKALNKQIDSLRKESDLGGEMVQLQDLISSLEHEKVSQEQQIVELRGTVTELQDQVELADRKVSEMADQISSKDQLVSELMLKLEERDYKIESLKQLETRGDLQASKEYISDLQLKLEEARSAVKELQCRYDVLDSQKLASDLTTDQPALILEKSEQQLPKDSQAAVIQQELRTKIVHSEESLVPRIEYLEQVISDKQLQVQELEQIVKSSFEKIERLSFECNSGSKCIDCENLRHELNLKQSVQSDLETEVEKLKLKCSGSEVSISECSVVNPSQNALSITEVEEGLSDLKRQLIEASGELELKREECYRLESKLKAQMDKTRKIAVNLKVKTVANKELEERVSKFEAIIQSQKTDMDQVLREKADILEKWQTEISEKDLTLNQMAETLASKSSEIENLSSQLERKSASVIELEERLTATQNHVEDIQQALEEKCALINKLNSNVERDDSVNRDELARLQSELLCLQNQLSSEVEEKQALVAKLESLTKQAKIKLAKEKKIRSDLMEKVEALTTEKNEALAVSCAKHEQEVKDLLQEREQSEALLKSLQEEVFSLRQELELERNKLQYANENVSVGEQTEETQELLLLPSVASFEDEIEILCQSCNYNSPQDIIPILEDEKMKTMGELSSSFESIHNQIIARLHNRPDLHGDRKLFLELRNLVTRVINRTTALENKIKKVITESEMQIQKKLLDAEKSIQTLENTVLESKENIDMKENEKSILTETVTRLQQEKQDLFLQIDQERLMSCDLDIKLKETQDQLNSVTLSLNSLLLEASNKESMMQDLQVQCQEAAAQKDHVLFEMHQNKAQLESTIVELTKLQQVHHEVQSECEKWRCKVLQSEQEVSQLKQRMYELETQLHEAKQQIENLEHHVEDFNQKCKGIELDYLKTTQVNEELQQQLAEANHLKTQLQQAEKRYVELERLWECQREESERQIAELSRQLDSANMSKTTEQIALQSSGAQNEVESLQRQLAEKTSEVENYQQRLLQLQLSAGASEFGQTLSIFSAEKEQSLLQGQVEGAQQNQKGDSDSLLDAFKPASLLFETSHEITELQNKILSLREQCELQSSQNSRVETEKASLEKSLNHLREQLEAAQRDLSTAQSDGDNLRLKVSELTAALNLSQTCVEQEKFIANKLQDDYKALQWKLENETYKKEKAETEAQRKTDERPSIPQSLDTHVSSLQESGSSFGSKEKLDVYAEGVDESLMEKNITQLESELRGMVSSQQELSTKKKARDDSLSEKENAEDLDERRRKAEIATSERQGDVPESAQSLFKEVQMLKKQIVLLEEERNSALSQVDTFKAELTLLSQSSTGARDTNDPVGLSVRDTLLAEDDSWGWGAVSADLESQHQQQKNQNQPFGNAPFSELQMKIDALEKDKLQLAEDLKTSQIRAAKLTRKLRELKAKNEELSEKKQSVNSSLDNLDLAIEEERLKQMQNLEKALNEIQEELKVVKIDREKLLKQVDIFSSANERLLEGKERQDVEVEMWQKRSKDLTNQVQALEWKIQELEENKSDGPIQNIESSVANPSPSEKLNTVEIDQLLKENHTWNANYENLMQEYQKLRAQCLAESEQHTQVDALLAQQKGMIERLEHEKSYFQDVYDSLKMDYEAACAQLALKQAGHDDIAQDAKTVNELKDKLSYLETQVEEAVSQLNQVSSDNSELQAQCSLLHEEKVQLIQKLSEYQATLEAKVKEINKLEESLRTFERQSMNETAPSIELPHFSQESERLSKERCAVDDPAGIPQHLVHAQESSGKSSKPVNWGDIVPAGEHSSFEVFDSIAMNTSQVLEEQLQVKDNEMQRDKRMIETLKRTHEEAEQEWGQIIEYHKCQLETAKKTINDLVAEIESLKSNASEENVASDIYVGLGKKIEEYQLLQETIIAKEKEIESLQISLAVSEDSRKKIEEQLHSKETELSRMSSETVQNAEKQVNLTEPSTSSFTLSNFTTVDSVPGALATSPSDSNLSNALDQALCMLHERDVRCEELTLELTRLLEERDALQLRLSDAIRTNEELRERLKQLMQIQSDGSNVDTPSITQSMDVLVSKPPVEISRDASLSLDEQSGNSGDDLEKKLAEIRKIGYSHDKWLREDREYRHQQQMQLLSPVSPQSSEFGNSCDENIAEVNLSLPSNTPMAEPNQTDQSSCTVS